MNVQKKAYLFLVVCFLVSSGISQLRAEQKSQLSNLYHLDNYDYKRMRFSSADPTGGNADGLHNQPIEPGETRVLAEIQGAGCIQHIWSTIASDEKNHLRKLVLRMYWDGETNPSVEAPIGDFFGLGHGEYYLYSSMPLSCGINRAMNCFWQMPFGTSAKITLTNEGKKAPFAFYYYIDYYMKLDKLDENIGRFHAKYRQESPCEIGQDYLILEAQGKGVYLGCNLSIHMMESGWWGEGDDKIYIDGAEKPTLVGTGAEDYFSGAWCYEGGEPFSYPYYGCPLNGGNEDYAKWNVYRYHIEDPIPFEKSIKVYIEHGHGSIVGRQDSWNAPAEYANDRPDVYSSVAYWYQTEPHKEFYERPPVKERIKTLR